MRRCCWPRYTGIFRHPAWNRQPGGNCSQCATTGAAADAAAAAAAAAAAGEDAVAVAAEARDRVGIGWREPLAAGIYAHIDEVDVVEVIAENYLKTSRR